MRWICLSLVAIRQNVEGKWGVLIRAKEAMDLLGMGDEPGNDDALAVARVIDTTLQITSNRLIQLYEALGETEDLTEQVVEILRGHESRISDLEQNDIEADRLKLVDYGIFRTQSAVNEFSHQITCQIPGVFDGLDPERTFIPFSRLVELFRDTRKLRFIQPGQILKGLCSPATTLRNILEGQGDADAYKELLKNLGNFSRWKGDEMQRQFWCLQDLHLGGGLGFTVELFFLALSQPLSISSSKESDSHSALYTGTFRAITSDWSKYKDSLGTQNCLLGLAISHHREFAYHYPAYITDEFLLLLGNIFEGQIGPHIDEARDLFEPFDWDPRRFKERALRVLIAS